MKILSAALAMSYVFMLGGCEFRDPTPKENDKLNKAQGSGRIKVVSAQYIKDARGYARDILVLRDSETGREYIAVMGAGVLDMHIKTNGKTTTSVEE